jgi:choline dehydrogenase
MPTGSTRPHLGGRRIFWPRGKVLGGSSAINGMIHTRGLPVDYDGWQIPGWSYDSMRPYFHLSLREGGGPLPAMPPPQTNPLFDAFLAAGRQAGFPATDSFNGDSPDGFGRYDMNVAEGSRWSAARAFLHPVRGRGNLEVLTHAHLLSVLLESGKAVGVELLVRGRTRRIRAAREVILSCGAVGSPIALLRSGIGDPEALTQLGLKVQVPLPGVGRNLQDHVIVRVQHLCTQKVTLHGLMRADRAGLALARALLFGTGPAAVFPLQTGAFYRSQPGMEVPDLQSTFVPGLSTAALRLPFAAQGQGHGYFANVHQMRPESVGTIGLRSLDPKAAPVIRPNYLSTATDRRVLRDGVRILRDIMAQPAFDRFRGPEIAPGPTLRSDAELDAWIARTASTAFHPAGLPHGHRRPGGGGPGSAGAGGAGPARGGCLGDAARDQRQHACTGDGDRRAGGRSHSGSGLSTLTDNLPRFPVKVLTYLMRTRNIPADREDVMSAQMSRRFALGAAASALAMPAIGQGRRPLIVEAFGGLYEKALRDQVIPEFEKRTGFDVTLVVGDDPSTIAKIVSARNRPSFDVVSLNNDSAILLQQLGLVMPDQSAKLKNIGRIYDSMKPPQTALYGMIIYEYALVYNTRKLPVAPTSWLDLWTMKATVGVPHISQSYGMTFLYIAAVLNGGSATNLTPGFEAIKRLPNYKVYKNVGQGLTMFQQGEIDAALYYGHRAQQMIDMDFPIAKTRPKEGVWGQRTGTQIPKTAANLEGALAWVDTTLDVPYQTVFADQMYSPTNRDVTLPPALAAKHIMGDARVASVQEAPWAELLPQRDALLDRWTREIGT